jgi:hypothetical protein
MLADFHSIYHHQLSVSGASRLVSSLGSLEVPGNRHGTHIKGTTTCTVVVRTAHRCERSSSCLVVRAACGGRVADEAPELEGGERKALEELIGWVLLFTVCTSALLPSAHACGSVESQRRQQRVLGHLQSEGMQMASI